jgi:hypothetical protein
MLDVLRSLDATVGKLERGQDILMSRVGQLRRDIETILEETNTYEPSGDGRRR